MLATIEASPPPIWAQGPSLPADPPQAKVMTVVTSLISWRCTASITFSVPCPSASGARDLVIYELNARARGSRKKYRECWPRRSALHLRHVKKKVVAIPTSTPTMLAIKNHLKMLIRSMDSSVMDFLIYPN